MSLNLVRPLGGCEHGCLATIELLKAFNVVIGNKIHFRPPKQSDQGPTEISSLKTSQQWAKFLCEPLSQLIDQFPNLTVVIDDIHSPTPNFVRLNSIDIANLIRVASIETAADINHQLEIETGTPLNLEDKTTPLWRLLISPIKDEPSSFYLVFILGHVIVDGVSAMVLTEQFIERLNAQTTTTKHMPNLNSLDHEKSTTVSITSTKPFEDPVELVADCKPSISKILRTVGWGFLPKRLKAFVEPEFWSGDFGCDEDCSAISQVELLQLTEQETIEIINAAKQHSTTVHSIIYTASIFSLKSVFIKNSNEAINVGTPFDLRGFLPNPIPRSHQGNYATFIDTNVHVSNETEFWETTMDYREKIQQGRREAEIRDHLETFGMLALIPKKEGAVKQALVDRVNGTPHGRTKSLSITNIGVGWGQDDKTKEQVEYLVEDAIFSVSPMVTEIPLNLAVATANNRLSFTLIWSKSSFDNGRERMKLFLQVFRKTLMEAVESNGCYYFNKDTK